MPFYSVKLLAKKEVARETTAFFFEKPKNQSTQSNLSARPSSQRVESSGFKFVPGQFIEIHLNKNLSHEFSIASSPKEKELMVTTRMRPSAFKNSLKKLKIGSRVKIDGPFGQFVLHQNKKVQAVFLAGGIGITPFRSMIKEYSNRKITLFYSNRKPEDAAFLKELKELEKKNKNFKLVVTMTNMKNSSVSWDGLKKHIDKKMIKNHLKWLKKVPISQSDIEDLPISSRISRFHRGFSTKSGLDEVGTRSTLPIGTIYYAVGSTGFVQSMANLLLEMKIKPEQIKTENFSGY